jgi:hypothetical protein
MRLSMPKIVRPRHEFPTPLFRAFVGALAGALGGLPIWIAAPHWANPSPALAVAGFAAFVDAVLVASLGEAPRRLAIGFVVGLVVLLAGCGVAVAVASAVANLE